MKLFTVCACLKPYASLERNSFMASGLRIRLSLIPSGSMSKIKTIVLCELVG